MIWKRLKKPAGDEMQVLGERFDDAQVGWKDRFAMILSAFLVLVLPSLLVLLVLSLIVLALLGLL